MTEQQYQKDEKISGHSVLLSEMFRDGERTEAYNTMQEAGHSKDENIAGACGVIGALVGSGIPEERVKLYESENKKEHIVMGVLPRNDEEARYFEDNWRTKKEEKIIRISIGN